jgi:hypothetical protein
MATSDATAKTLGDFGVDPDVTGGDHVPTLHPGDRFVRCTACGVSVSYAVAAEGRIRRALEELSAIECGRYERPDASVGDHVPTVTPGHADGSRRVVCESCGRAAPLGADRQRVLEDLAAIPCVDRLSYEELVGMVFSPTTVTPTLAAIGIDHWSGRPGRHHPQDVSRVFRHDRYQYAASVRENDDGTYTAAVTASPGAGAEVLGELRFPSDGAVDPATRRTAETFVTFLAATDDHTAGEFARLRTTYEDAAASNRAAWLDDAYERAAEKFRERHGESPAAFAEAFAGGVDDDREVLRRLVGPGGFEDVEESTFAREILGHDDDFPGFVDYVADRSEWSPAVTEG